MSRAEQFGCWSVGMIRLKIAILLMVTVAPQPAVFAQEPSIADTKAWLESDGAALASIRRTQRPREREVQVRCFAD